MIFSFIGCYNEIFFSFVKIFNKHNDKVRKELFFEEKKLKDSKQNSNNLNIALIESKVIKNIVISGYYTSISL